MCVLYVFVDSPHPGKDNNIVQPVGGLIGEVNEMKQMIDELLLESLYNIGDDTIEIHNRILNHSFCNVVVMMYIVKHVPV